MVRLKVVAGVEVRKRGRGGRAQSRVGPELLWMVRETALFWNRFGEQLDFPKFNAIQSKGQEQVFQTHIQYLVSKLPILGWP